MPTLSYLSLGGNLGSPKQSITKALAHLDQHPAITLLDQSAFYKTPPWGKTDQPAFINACAKLKTTLTAHELLDICLATEAHLGRVRDEKWGPRLIDIDLLTFGEEKTADDRLRLPHPHMMKRAFVLVPLAEIAPDLAIAGQSIAEACTLLDCSDIEKLQEGASQ